MFNLLMTSDETEHVLERLLESVDWVGALEITESDFNTLAMMVRRRGRRGKMLYVDDVPPIMLVTSMVFSARYANAGADERPSFWLNYAQQVWDLPADSPSRQSLEQHCRSIFRETRSHLEQRYGFYFPEKLHSSDQDVVGGIYLHAVIPRYLQDDFAHWLIDLWRRGGATWQQIIDMPLETLIDTLQQDTSLSYVPVRLRNYVRGDETRETTARLVQALFRAASLYEEGKSPEFIAGMLSAVERPLWRELAKALEVAWQTSKSPAVSSSRQPHWDWVWMPESDSFGVRLRGVEVQGESPPDRGVFVNDLNDLPDYPCFTEVFPRRDGDSWLVDEALLDFNRISNAEGYFVLVDTEDRPVSKPIDIHPPPSQSFYFFKIGRDTFATLVDVTQVRSDGDWMIALAQHAVMENSSGNVLIPNRQYAVPAVLDAIGAITAGLFQVTLPLKLRVDQQLYAELQPRFNSISATISDGVTVSGLATSNSGLRGRTNPPADRERASADDRAT